jgi:hypothetical protein
MINMPGLEGFRLYDNPHMTETETETFPEQCWWRRLYRTHRVDVITWPLRDLYILPGGNVYGHPMVIRRLKEILELDAMGHGIHELKTEHYPPVKVESHYVYNWRIAASTLMLIVLLSLVLWCAAQAQ